MGGHLVTGGRKGNSVGSEQPKAAPPGIWWDRDISLAGESSLGWGGAGSVLK